MRLGVYVRVSTENQTKGESLGDQETDAREWAKRNGHSIFEVYSDPGISGTAPVEERPGLAAVLEDLGAGRIEGFVVRALDRLARELTIQEAVLAQAWRHNGRVFTFAGEVLADDPDDPMRTAMRQMMGVFAGLERAMIAKRMRDGRRHKRERGEHPGGPAPFGWRADNKELIPLPSEQYVLSVIRDLRVMKLTQDQIVERLNVHDFKTRSGVPWSRSVLKKILERDAKRSPVRAAYEAQQLARYAEPEPPEPDRHW